MVVLISILTKESYSEYCNLFKIVWGYLNDVSYDENSVIQNICSLRGYSLETMMPSMLKKIGFVFIDDDLFDESKLIKINEKGSLGLYTKEGKFLLRGRFIFPVKDMLGNIIALIGWYPDEKKYVTTPSKFFSKKNLFFGLEQLKKTGIGKEYILVEGIFDCISVRSMGANCIAMMGISVSNYTEAMYSLFKRLIAIPDNDKEGKKVLLNDKWRLPSNSSYLNILGKYKDIDDVCKDFDMFGTFKDIWKEKERIISLDLN